MKKRKFEHGHEVRCVILELKKKPEKVVLLPTYLQPACQMFRALLIVLWFCVLFRRGKTNTLIPFAQGQEKRYIRRQAMPRLVGAWG